MLIFDLKIYLSISILIIFILLKSQSIFGQSGMSLYHLQGAVFQVSHYNPAFMPEGKVFLGLPVISGIGINYNNRLSYNDVITKSKTGIGNDLNFKKMISALNRNRNYLSLEADISTFYLGIRPNVNMAISFFVRERIGVRLFIPKEFFDFVWNGNAALIGKKVDISDLETDNRYYREIGIGYWRNLPNKKLSLGVHFKLLIGFFNASTHRKFKGTVTTLEDNYQIRFDFSDATLNTSGKDLLNGNDIATHLINNVNKGLGIDLGAKWKFNPDLSFALAVNDLGYINWKKNSVNYTITDTTFNYGGVNLKNVSDIEKKLKDSLVEKFNNEERNKFYKTLLNTRIYGSVMYNLTERDIFTATIANHGVLGRLRMLYGVGYTRKNKILIVSVNAIKHPQSIINLGLGMAVDLNPFQLYIASDRLFGYRDVTELTGLDFKFGINFIFGRGNKNDDSSKTKFKKDNKKDLKHDYGKIIDEYGNKKDGIYWIVPKEKPRPIYKKRKFRDV